MHQPLQKLGKHRPVHSAPGHHETHVAPRAIGTPDQLNYVFWVASYWDTRGWIYFLRGDNTNARSYVEASWSLP
jgi:hypothetical protein